MHLFTPVFLSVLLTLMKTLAVNADELHYVKAKVDDVLGKLEILEDFIKHQNEVIDSQNKRITVLEDIVLQQKTWFNQKVTSHQKKLKDDTKMNLGNSQEDDILHQKKGKEDHLKNIISMPKTLKARKEMNKTRMDTDSKKKSFIDTSTVEGNRYDTKEVERKHSGTGMKTYPRRSSPTTSPQRIAFTAYLDKTVSHLGIDQPIPFNKVLLNDGNSFNNFTGMFRCPVTGVYLFTFWIESDRLGDIVVKLVIDRANQIDAITTSSNGTFGMGGNTAIVRVTAGQMAWLAIYTVNDRTIWNQDNYRYTSFSGVLLY